MSSLPNTAPTPLRPTGAPRPIAASLVVGIVAAYPSLRAGLATLIQNDRNLTASAIPPQALAGGERGHSTLRLSEMDVVLVEPRELAPEMLARLDHLAEEDDVPLIWLRSPQNPLEEYDLEGAGGIVSVEIDGDTLVAAIRAVAQGLRVIDPELVSESAHTVSTANALPSGYDDGILSPREREVLSLVAAGMPNKAIARTLGISDHTVKFHVSSVLTKLDAGSRTEAVTLASRRGILSL